MFYNVCFKHSYRLLTWRFYAIITVADTTVWITQRGTFSWRKRAHGFYVGMQMKCVVLGKEIYAVQARPLIHCNYKLVQVWFHLGDGVSLIAIVVYNAVFMSFLEWLNDIITSRNNTWIYWLHLSNKEISWSSLFLLYSVIQYCTGCTPSFDLSWSWAWSRVCVCVCCVCAPQCERARVCSVWARVCASHETFLSPDVATREGLRYKASLRTFF